ncbi:hypothetical protein [uncultured Parabacteroides sp.]|uniref:hypothetical protein n=1 Tax=uncultured Parabacteroides sp. TaxID=512312 RepID=UPI0028048999|nr:hypothetical protein [uncultured Parabacteroides sp.]MBD9167710.1 hypothetical protein [Parabacteroides johnsonii]
MTKNILFVFLGFLLLISCEQEDFISNGNSVLQTKSTDILNPIDQLANIPVNIRVIGKVDKDYNYLSSNKKSNIVDRHSEDDGSLRQRWYINKNIHSLSYDIKVAGGAQVNGKISLRGGPDQYYPVLYDGEFNDRIFLEYIPNTPYYNIYYKQPFRPTLYLYAEGSNRDLLFKEAYNTDNRAIWEIIPVEDFKLIDIKYSPTAGEKFKPTLDYIKSRTITNDGDTQITYGITISEKIMESSTFSEVEGITMTDKITTKVSVGLPIIKEGGEISYENTTARNWSYQESQTEQKERVIQDNFSLEIPPHSKYIIDITAVTYNIDVTYIATLVGKQSGKTIQLKGTWQGVECDGIDYHAYTLDGKPTTITGLRYFKCPLK